MKKFVIIITVILIGHILLSFVFALDGYPGFFQDSVCFLPTTYFINHFHQLINPLYDAGIDPLKHRFLFYPPLFPYVVAYIVRVLPPIINNIQVALTIIDSISILLLTFCIYIYNRKNPIKSKPSTYLFLVSWLLALFSFYNITDGRPEVLCRLFISCFLLNNLVPNNRFSNFNNGLIIGLNLITSPISSFYLMVINVGLLFYKNNFKLYPIIKTLLGFTIVLLCFTALYPYHISELIAGLRQHSQNVIVHRTEVGAFKNFISNYITNPYNPLCFFNILIAIISIYYLAFKKNNWFCLTLIIILTGMISYFSFRNMGLIYNFLVIAPFSFFILFVIFEKTYNKRSKSFLINILPAAITILLFINSLGYVRTVLLYVSTENNKVSYKEFRKEFVQVSKKTDKNKKIVITWSLWPYCLDNYKNIDVWTTTLIPDTLSAQYIITQQLYSGKSVPELKPYYKVIKNNYNPQHPKFLMLPLGNTYPWFQSAIYKKE